MRRKMGSGEIEGKVCLITGGNSGIGKATALGLAEMGASIVIVGRNKERCDAAVAEIKEKSGNKSVDVMLADLSSQSAVRKMADEFTKEHSRLDILVNDAGVTLFRRRVTVDGIEITFAVNHLAYFLLTNLLLELLKKSAHSRIVNVASAAHYGAKVDFEDIQGERHYSSLRAYGQSKLANVLFTYELARKLEGTGITANCLHPGFVQSNLGRDNGAAFLYLFRFMKAFTARSPEKGAETVVYLASSPEVAGITGKYFTDKKEVKSSDESYDGSTAKRLWELSEELTGLAK